jgi:hypothetical protein
MKRTILSIALGALALTAASVASARVHVSVAVSPFGYGGYYPPAAYNSDPYYDPYYAAPPIAYFGGGSWGHGRDWHDRGRNGRHPGHDDHDGHRH